MRSFHAMRGLDYVALRYFNVYGPRMDITASTPRCWCAGWSASKPAQPPLILGDGSQTMDFVYIAMSPAPTCSPRPPMRATRCSTSPAATETSLLELAHLLIEVMGADLPVEHGPERGGQQGSAAPRRDALAREVWASRPRSDSKRACAGWSSGGVREPPASAAGAAPAPAAAVMEIPFTRPHLVGAERRGGRRGDRLGLDLPGAACTRRSRRPSRRGWAPPTPSPRRAARRRCSLRSMSRAWGPATR